MNNLYKNINEGNFFAIDKAILLFEVVLVFYNWDKMRLSFYLLMTFVAMVAYAAKVSQF